MSEIIHNIKKIIEASLYPISLYSRQAAGTVVLLFLARYLSVYDYGLFSSYKTIAGFWLMFANLGFAEYILVSSNKIVREVQLKIGLFLINAFALACLVGFLSIYSTLEFKFLFILVLIRQFLDGTFFNIALPYFQAANKFKIISCVNLFYSFMTVIIATSCYFFKLSLLKFLLFSILLGVINFIQVSCYANINYLIVFKNLIKIAKKIDKSIFVYMGVCLLGYLYSQIPALYISIFVTKEDAALYFAAFTFANIVFLLLSAQSQKIVPEMMRTSIQNVKNIIKKNIILIFSINLLILIFFILFGKFLLKIIYSNPYYTNAYFILLLLTIANFAFAVVTTQGSYITACGKQNMKLKMQLEVLIFSVIMLFVLHRYNLYGAALTYLFTAIYLAIRYTQKTKELIRKEMNL